MVRVAREEDTSRLGMLAELLERLPAAVAYLTGEDHVFEIANETCLRIVGQRDVVGRPAREALPEMTALGYVDLLDEVRATGEALSGNDEEITVRTETGEPRQVFVDYRLEPVRGEAGEVVGVLVHAVDVTDHVLDRRRLESLAEELTVAQERYRTLFETMLHGVVYHDAEGMIVAANPMAGQMLGVDPEALVGLTPQGENWQAVREDETPFPGDEHPAMVALRTGEIVGEVVMGVAHGVTGERRWLAVTAVPDARDEHGRPHRAYAMFRDITEQRHTAEALRERESFLGHLRDANVLGILVADENRVIEANDAFLDMVGYSRDDLEEGRIDWRGMTPEEWLPQADLAVTLLRRTGVCPPFDKEYFHADGHRVPALVGAALVQRDPMRWVTFVADLSERRRAEEERARLIASAQAARAEAERADESLGLLLRAGALVAATRDRCEVLRNVTRLVVPAIADLAAVFLPTDDGYLLASVTEHKDEAGAAILADLERHRVPVTGDGAVRVAFRTARSQLVQDVPTRLGEWRDVDPCLADVATRLRVDSKIAIPLVQDAEVLGVLWVGRSRGRNEFTKADVKVAEELGRRLATGLTHAEVIAREHTVAEMLQRSVLPEVLPSVPGLDLAVVYLPATEGVDVGGDWYDAFPLGEERMGIVLGDVVGHNLATATAMNQVRNALRAYAVDEPDPSLVLQRTNTVLTRLLPESMATVFYGVLDLGAGELTYANAGHPPPLLVARDGARYLTGGGGLMLGVADEAACPTAVAQLEAGSALLLYSDGLVEDRRRSLEEGLDTLAYVFTGRSLASAEEMCAAAQAALLEGPTRADDVCLLAVRLAGTPSEGWSGVRGAGPG
jgi:PAS domain S-box-containing protein